MYVSLPVIMKNKKLYFYYLFNILCISKSIFISPILVDPRSYTIVNLFGSSSSTKFVLIVISLCHSMCYFSFAFFHSLIFFCDTDTDLADFVIFVLYLLNPHQTVSRKINCSQISILLAKCHVAERTKDRSTETGTISRRTTIDISRTESTSSIVISPHFAAILKLGFALFVVCLRNVFSCFVYVNTGDLEDARDRHSDARKDSRRRVSFKPSGSGSSRGNRNWSADVRARLGEDDVMSELAMDSNVERGGGGGGGEYSDANVSIANGNFRKLI